MEFSADQIAMIIGARIEGSPDAKVASFGKIEEAEAGQLSFLANPKYEEYLYCTKASIVIINESFELKQPVEATLLRVEDAYSSFAILLSKYQELQIQQLSGIQQPSFIADTAKLGENVFVAAFCYIGKNVQVGNNVKLLCYSIAQVNVSQNSRHKKCHESNFTMQSVVYCVPCIITPFPCSCSRGGVQLCVNRKGGDGRISLCVVME